MSEYSKYVVTELKAPFPPEAAARYATFATRILWMDENVVPGAFQMNCSWYRKAFEMGPEPHVHDTNEIIGFFGNDAADPYNLHGEVEFWLGDEKQTITKSAMIFIPAGMKHCPLIIRRVDKPIFHFSVVTEGQWITKKAVKEYTPATEYSRYVVTDLIMPEDKRKIAAAYNKYARRVLWLDKDVAPGAFNMNTAWYLKAAMTLEDKPHTHDTDEIIGFFGNDAARPNDLGGEIEIWLGDEKQVITKSAMIFVPAGLVHCPLNLKRVDRPIFHFTVVPSQRYVKNEKR
ncbi:MAG: hypothetical protein WC370_07675 [Dehalococcoidales bacterium]|jgi:mannose-6-phosphate isomerase-like protein (cupin superfamily)